MQPSGSASSHETLIRALLFRPFKLPLADYSAADGGRSLGMRRAGVRVPLHDPYEEGALVLYWPPELSAHELMKVAV